MKTNCKNELVRVLILFSLLVFTGCNSFNNNNPPSDVIDLTVIPQRESFTLNWKTPVEGYYYNAEILVQSVDGKELLNFTTNSGATKYVVTDLNQNSKYIATVYAMDSNRNKSTGVRTEVQLTDSSILPEVTDIESSITTSEIILLWTNPVDSMLTGTEITVTPKEKSSIDTQSNSSSVNEDSSIVVIEDANTTLTKISNLLEGKEYSITFRTLYSDGLVSSGITYDLVMKNSSSDLDFSLSRDGNSYILSRYYGDNSSLHTITPEQEIGTVAEPIEVVVPSFYENKPVVAIGSRAFKNCRSVVKVILPETLERIEYNAFEGCTGLKSLIIPEGVTTIADGSFWNCVSLEWIVIPKSVSFIGLGAILGDSKLAHILYTGTQEQWFALLPSIMSGNTLLTVMNSKLFSKTQKINFNYDGISPIEFEAPDQVLELNALTGMSHIKLSWSNPNNKDFCGVNITVIDSNSIIAKSYFIKSPLINSFIITGLDEQQEYSVSVCTVDKIGNCSKPVTVQKLIPAKKENVSSDGIKYFVNETGNECIVYDAPLDSSIINIPSSIDNYSVIGLNSGSISNNKTVKSLVLPETIKFIAENAIVECPFLNDIFYTGDINQWQYINGTELLNYNVHCDFIYNPQDKEPPSDISDYISVVTKNSISIFYLPPKENDFTSVDVITNPYIEKISLIGPNLISLEDIASETLYQINIRSKDLYGNVSEGISITAEPQDINNSGTTPEGFVYDFFRSEMYKGVIAYQITDVDQALFGNNDTLIIPELINNIPVVSIKSGAFEGLDSVSTVYLSNYLIDICSLKELKNLRKIEIGKNNNIYSSNVDGSVLYKIENTRRVVAYVLDDYSGVLDFTGSRVISINEGALKNCSLITSIILPTTLLSIGNNAFENCSSLRTISIPVSLQNIGTDAFLHCDKLSVCSFGGNQESWRNMDLSIRSNHIFNKLSFVYEND